MRARAFPAALFRLASSRAAKETGSPAGCPHSIWFQEAHRCGRKAVAVRAEPTGISSDLRAEEWGWLRHRYPQLGAVAANVTAACAKWPTDSCPPVRSGRRAGRPNKA